MFRKSGLAAGIVLGMVISYGSAEGVTSGSANLSDRNTTAPGVAGPVRWAIAIHGGAGTVSRKASPEEQKEHLDALATALKKGADILAAGGSSLDAVEQAVRSMEDNPALNAGKGAVFNREGVNELDAAIMDGGSLDAGAVGAVRHVKNPVSLARQVMESKRHVLLVGPGAEAFAKTAGVDMVPDDYFFTERRYRQLQRAKVRESSTTESAMEEHGTVGAVALDVSGNLAAATSTGGITNKWPGRVGDSPIIGAGTYANNATCAVSCTGHGELFIRHLAASRVSVLMELRGESLGAAADEVVSRLLPGKSGGLIAVDRHGNVALPYSTSGMNRGMADSSGKFQVAIWEMK